MADGDRPLAEAEGAPKSIRGTERASHAGFCKEERTVWHLMKDFTLSGPVFRRSETQKSIRPYLLSRGSDLGKGRIGGTSCPGPLTKS